MDKVDRLLGSMSAKVEDAFTAKSRTEEEYQLWLKKHAAMKDAETQVLSRSCTLPSHAHIIFTRAHITLTHEHCLCQSCPS